MAIVGDILLLAVGTVALALGARWLVDGASRLAQSAGISPLVVGLTVVAFGTSAPEFAVSIGAALEGQADVSVGNVVGSNVFNIGLVLGGAAVIAPFRVRNVLVRRDAVAMGATTALALAVLADLSIGRLEGALLVGLLVAYLGALFVAARASTADRTAAPAGWDPADDDASAARSRSWVDVGLVLVGLVLVALGGRVLVDAATRLALDAGVSEWLVGVTLVAAGTSLPELATSVVAARRGAVAIVAGNVVGSNVFNLLGVLGVAALIRPLSVDATALLGLAWLLVLTAITTVLLATGRRLTRLEGLTLVALLLVYWGASVLA
ncbi:calcium/sodium antiporter [Natribaculum luteum]|uniref:Calcium/sodium antiporter n=1 Tax=Natribaculum luteum TaxID=1586232 RepID=A0ABD5NTX5_9EURY|nr:calcium/sodium antiporter [Natribaculum luteum]